MDLALPSSSNSSPRPGHRIPRRPAGHRRRHADGALPHLISGPARRGAGAGREDGDRHVDGHHHVHLDLQRARPPPARRGALGHRLAARAGHRDRRHGRQPGRFRAAQGHVLAIFFAALRRLLGDPDVPRPGSPQPTRQMPGTGRPGGRGRRDRLPLRAGGRRRRLRQRAVHGLVQRRRSTTRSPPAPRWASRSRWPTWSATSPAGSRCRGPAAGLVRLHLAAGAGRSLRCAA